MAMVPWKSPRIYVRLRLPVDKTKNIIRFKRQNTLQQAILTLFIIPLIDQIGIDSRIRSVFSWVMSLIVDFFRWLEPIVQFELNSTLLILYSYFISYHAMALSRNSLAVLF